MNENIFNLLEREIILGIEDLNNISIDIIHDLDPILFRPFFSFRSNESFLTERKLNLMDSVNFILRDILTESTGAPTGQDLDLRIRNFYMDYIGYIDQVTETSTSDVEFYEDDNKFSEYLQEYFIPALNENQNSLENSLIMYFVENYYELMKLKLEFLFDKDMAGNLERFHRSPELIITVLIAIFSGVGTSLLVKYLPDKEDISIFRAKNTLVVKLRSFYGWIRRKKPEYICKEEVQFLEKKIDDLTETLDYYKKMKEKSINNYSMVKTIENIVKEIEKKVKILYEIQLNFKEKLDRILFRRKEYRRESDFDEEIDLVMNTIFSEEQVILPKINDKIINRN